MWPVMRSVAQGAATSCYVVANDGAAGVSGEYFANCRPARCNPLARDRELAARLWEVSEALVAEAHPSAETH